jgi:hypothetical protein
MDSTVPVVEDEPAEAPPPRSRRPVVAGVALAVLVVSALGYLGWRAADSSVDVADDGPAEAVAPGGPVVVDAAEGEECGVLFTSLHRKGALGLWNQTHSGNIFDGFQRDERPWWSLPGRTYFTPVPCSIGGKATFTLPEDVGPGTIAACDSAGRCAEIRVAD